MYGRKHSLPSVSYCAVIKENKAIKIAQHLRKDSRFLGRDWNVGPSEYQSVGLLTGLLPSAKDVLNCNYSFVLQKIKSPECSSSNMQMSREGADPSIIQWVEQLHSDHGQCSGLMSWKGTKG